MQCAAGGQHAGDENQLRGRDSDPARPRGPFRAACRGGVGPSPAHAGSVRRTRPPPFTARSKMRQGAGRGPSFGGGSAGQTAGWPAVTAPALQPRQAWIRFGKAQLAGGGELVRQLPRGGRVGPAVAASPASESRPRQHGVQGATAAGRAGSRFCHEHEAHAYSAVSRQDSSESSAPGGGGFGRGRGSPAASVARSRGRSGPRARSFLPQGPDYAQGTVRHRPAQGRLGGGLWRAEVWVRGLLV